MREIINSIIKFYYNTASLDVKELGGGFYGRVFLAVIDSEPFNVVLKVYLYNGLADKEAAQLKVLSEHATVKMPNVYFTHNANSDIPNDVLAMEYIPGVNAGGSKLVIPESSKLQIAEIIVDNLISYHNAVNHEGFGEIGSELYEPDWKRFYYPKVDSITRKAECMYKNNQLSHDIFSIISRANANFDRVFYIPVNEARLIHGDYNTWNVLLDDELTQVKAVIDPFNCCWADSELDLYQLTNANGNYYGLLELYSKKFPLSENFLLKKAFYELFTEIMHYYDAGVDVKRSSIPEQANVLNSQMDYFGLA